MTRFTPNARGSTRIEDTSTFADALLQQRRFRLEQLTELTAARTGSAGSTDSQADAQEQVSRLLRAAALSALADVDAALLRIEQGVFGRCVECAQDIQLERLEILPMAALCMPCQRRREQPTSAAPAETKR
jgi:RNA polymerase-binding transcription factor DksA